MKYRIGRLFIFLFAIIGLVSFVLHQENLQASLAANLQAPAFDPCSAQPSETIPNIILALVEDGFTQPVFLTHANDGSGRLFIVEQPGLIRIIKDSFTLPTPFLDIQDRVSFGGERGLLSMAFHPNFVENGRFFVNYTASGDGRTVVAEYRVSDDPDVAAPDERIILEIDQPFSNHNGGQLQFSPDGFLYIGMGDGGSGGDPLGSGQNLATLLGALLRIDVDSETEPYGIPVDNPFIGQSGTRAEIYAYGLRNPWRFSFDRCDGRLFLADVGQNRIEEVDLVIKGGNYGWNTMEGSSCFPSSAVCIQGGLELPITEYFHDAQGGQSITGGYVYRGGRFPALAGRYFFADFVSGRLWALTEIAPGQWEREALLETGLNISSFGEDEQGELYITAFNGGVYRLEVEGASNVVSTIAQALDVNQNRLMDDAEILAAIRLWTADEVVPETNLKIDDQVMQTLIHQWTTGQSLEQTGSSFVEF